MGSYRQNLSSTAQLIIIFFCITSINKYFSIQNDGELKGHMTDLKSNFNKSAK